ncbi:MAG: signal peptidase II [Bacteroidetes bacterium]|nr:MAG: signal peptidase II [Bacteroidota bacterium]
MERNINRIILVLVTIGANIGLDQWTKMWARQELQFAPPRSYWNDFFRLLYVENKGAFLSLGSELPEGLRVVLLHVFPVVLLGALMVYAMFSRALNRWQIIGMSFIIGGGISNVVDRIMMGQVTDFMNMGLFGIRTGIFNFADVSIMLGLAIMLPFAFRKEDQATTTSVSTSAAVEKGEPQEQTKHNDA